MVQHIYKYLLAWPILFDDLQQVDENYYTALKQIAELAKSGEDVSMLCLEFTTTQKKVLGQRDEIELVERGAEIEVNNDNWPEYLEACFKDRMLDRVKPQMNELLLGFFDVIPEPLLTIFTYQELESLMCGLPQIDVDDWMERVEYCGDFDENGDHEVCQWFWEIVQDFDAEMRAYLLEFVTGKRNLYSTGGFGSHQGYNDLYYDNDNIRSIRGVPLNYLSCPQAE